MPIEPPKEEPPENSKLLGILGRLTGIDFRQDSSVPRDDRSLERFLLYSALVALLLFIAEIQALKISSFDCALQKHHFTIAGGICFVQGALLLTGIGAYCMRLGDSDRKRWFHLSALILIIFALLTIALYLAVSFAHGFGETDWCA